MTTSLLDMMTITLLELPTCTQPEEKKKGSQLISKSTLQKHAKDSISGERKSPELPGCLKTVKGGLLMAIRLASQIPSSWSSE